MFSNGVNFPGDHIAVFIIRQWTRRGNYRAKREIAETGMFAYDDVPAQIDKGTHARLAEIFDQARLRPNW
jgi:hypothetical protein